MWVGSLHVENINNFPLSIAETASFIADAKKLFTEEELAALKFAVAVDPVAGDVIEGTGGIRKLRVPLPGRGKSGGARLIYFYRNDQMPIFFLAAYAKSEQINISAGERRTMKKLVEQLVREYQER